MCVSVKKKSKMSIEARELHMQEISEQLGSDTCTLGIN